MNQELKSFYRLTVFCIGIKKRCRKEERHVLSAGEFPIETPIEVMREKAKALLDSDMRTVRVATGPAPYAIANFIEEKERGNGLTIQEWRPFSDKNLRFPLFNTSEAQQ